MVDVELEFAELSEASVEALSELFDELPDALPPLDATGGVGAVLPEDYCPLCAEESLVVASELLDEDDSFDVPPPFCWLWPSAAAPSCMPLLPEGPPCDMPVCSEPP